MKLYTRSGDDGSTGLFGGRRLSKADARVHAYGEVDELNAALGWAAVAVSGQPAERLPEIQGHLFAIGAELAGACENPARAAVVAIDDEDIRALEGWIDEATGHTVALQHFILPGGGEGGARLHMARAICRRAERGVVELAGRTALRPAVLCYLNRLGDLLFAWARLHNQAEGQLEVPWRPGPDPNR